MNAIVDIINAVGRAFVDFALPMLVQSTVLILVLLVVDALLRKRVRAVFRYWIWVLVLIKLVLPPSLWSPVSVGRWFGDELHVSAESLLEDDQPPTVEPPSTALQILSQPVPLSVEPFAGVPEPRAATAEPLALPAVAGDDRAIQPDTVSASVEAERPAPAPAAPVTALDWRGFALLAWASVVVALLLLLLQRAVFVQGLVAQAAEASASMQNVLDECRARIGLGRAIAMRISPNATSPAVCGLARPVILIPRNLAPKISRHDLHAVLLHELAHVKRGDLWISLAQTLLQIVYFYNPLLWLTNAVIRRVREKAVDEAVLVAMGESASDYPESLVNVAKLAFKRRPVLSLRLIGVVESKSALTARIKHILNRPFPKTAKLGGVGLLTLFALAAVLLPMAKAREDEENAVLSRLAVVPNCAVRLSDINGQHLPVLDFASERIIVLPAVQNERDLLRMTGPQDQGDVVYYYDSEKDKPRITFLGSAGLNGESVSDEYKALTLTPMRMPFETTVATRGNKRFAIRIIRADEHGCVIQFRPLGAEVSTPKAVLANGITVELLGVCEHPSAGRQWWYPDGSTMKEAPRSQSGVHVYAQTSESTYEFAVRLHDLPKGAAVTLKTEPMGARTQGPGVEGLRWLAATLPDDLRQCRLLCGIAAGAWETLAQSSGAAQNISGTALGGVMFSEASARADGALSVTTTDDIIERPCRVVAMAKDGRTIEASKYKWGEAGKARQTTSRFEGISLSEIAEFQFQTRPWTWIEFENVSLRPGRGTNVEVRLPVDQGLREQDEAQLDESTTLPLTRRTEMVMPLAEQEARRLNHGYVGTEHMLVALARDSEAVGARVLASFGVDADTLRAEMAKLVKPGLAPSPSGKLPRTPRVDSTFNYARQEATKLGHAYLGTEHLLLGILRERECLGAQMLVKLGLTLPRVRAELRKFVRAANEEDVNGNTTVPIPSSEPRPSRFAATLSNAVTVELLGVCTYPGADRQWWRPDGGSLPQAPCSIPASSVLHPSDGETVYGFVAQVTHVPDDARGAVKVPSARTQASYDMAWAADGTVRKDIWYAEAILAKNRKTCTVRCEVATDIWAEFENVSLQLGGSTNLAVKVGPSGELQGQRRIVLPDVDHEAVMLDDRGVFLLEQRDPDRANRGEDRLYLIDAAGKVRSIFTGLDLCETIGGAHMMAVDESRKVLWVAENAGNRLWKFDLTTGKVAGRFPDLRASAVAVDPESGNVWVAAEPELIRVVSPQGNVLATYEIPGYDIAYSSRDKSFWVVGKEICRVDRAGQIVARVTGVGYAAVSVATDPHTGEAWVAIASHSQVPKSRNELWHVDATGVVRHRLDLDELRPYCVRVDSDHSVVWVGCRGTTLRYDTSGNRLASTRGESAFSIALSGRKEVAYLADRTGAHEVVVLDSGHVKSRSLLSDVSDVQQSQKWIARVPLAQAMLPTSPEMVELVPTRQEASTPGIAVSASKTESADKLLQLGMALLIHAAGHEDRLPLALSEVRAEMSEPDFWWCREHAEYIGRGIKRSARALDDRAVVVAYDKTLLRQGEGTNVLFLDPHVEFLSPDRLQELAISTAETPDRDLSAGRIELPDVDHEAVMLDLAGGRLVPVPQVGPPEKLLEAIEELGKGDIVLDSRSLILVRGATSRQAEGGPADLVRLVKIGSHLPETFSVTTAEGWQYVITVLSIDDEACTLTYSLSPVEPMQTRSSSAPDAHANEPASALAFCVAVSRTDVPEAIVKRYEEGFAEDRRPPGGDYAWFEVRPNVTLSPELVALEREGTTFLLLRTGEPYVMRAGPGWAVERVKAATDAMDRPAVRVWLDDKGGERLHALTQANVKKVLAILVEGRVVAAPEVMSPVRDAVLIVGNYTQREVQEMIDVLRPKPPEQPVALSSAVSDKPGAGDSKDKTEPAADVLANLRQLALGVVLFAHDHEGDLPTTLRDIERHVPDRAQFAWMRANVTYVGKGNLKREAKAYAVPIAYRKAPESVGGAYVAFMDGHVVLVSSERCKELGIRRVAGEDAVGARVRYPESGPLGGHALSFDGVDDCLVVPPSASLTLKPPFFVEVWARPDLSVLPQERFDPRKAPYPAMDFICQGRAPKSAGPANLDSKANTETLDGWPVPSTVSRPLVQPLQSGGFATFLEGGVFVVDETSHAAQTGLIRTNQLEVDRPGWTHYYFELRRDNVARRKYVLAEGPLVIGRVVRNGFPFKGQIAEIRIWNKELSMGDMRYVGSTSVTGNEPNLVACWRFEEGSGQIVRDISPNANHAYLGGSEDVDDADPKWVDLAQDEASAPGGIAGRVVDADGKAVAGAQVAFCTETIHVTIQDGRLSHPRASDMEKGEIAETGAQGLFRFDSETPGDFSLIAAHDDGFALVELESFRKDCEIRLERWGRIEGQLASGRTAQGNQISMCGLPNSTWRKHRCDFRYETKCDGQGRFAFERVPAGRFEVGYLASTGRGSASVTSRTPVVVDSGRTATMKLGGEGRPVIGKLVPPQGYHGPIYFGQGLRSLSTSRPEEPRPENYDQMSRREQQAWHGQWRQTPEAEAFYEAMWSNLNWRHYCFSIQQDGSFRIEDVIPGKYDLNVWLEERFTGQGRPEEIGGYNGIVEVPPMAEVSTDEPLDLGELTLSMRHPLHVGDTVPEFEAETLDGKAISLADYRGRHVLLSFWSPTFHPELERLRELHADYGKTGQLQIIGLGGTDTRDEVTSYINEHNIAWPQIYFGSDWNADLFKKLGGQVQIILIDPKGKVVATWLRGDKLSDTVREAVAFAWQRTDGYVAPDPERFFPDDAEGGKRLDALFKAVDKDRRSDEEILSTVRRGFRRTKEYRSNILRWIGNRYVWGADPQNAEAIEIMYHAVGMERHYAIYFGLSVVKDKTPNILRALAEICMQGEDVGRITWGVGAQRDELVAYIKPYLDDADPQKRETASVLVQHFEGKLDFDRWKEEKRLDQAKVEFAGHLPKFKQTLLTGDSRARREVFTTIQREGLAALLDDSFVPAFQACGADPDRKVRNEVARMAGGRWVWGAQEQDPNAIALMLELASDKVRDVRYNAVYYGLSVVRDKTEPVVRRLVELALSDHENNLYGRIVWGLKGPMRASPEPFEKVLAEYLNASESNDHLAASVYLLYRDVLQKEPPAAWNLARIKQQYPDDLFTITFSAKEPFAPANSGALWNEFARTLPSKAAVNRVADFRRGKPFVCVAQVRSQQQADVVRQSIDSNPRLSLGKVRPVPLWVQLYEEEKRGMSSFPPDDEAIASLFGAKVSEPGPVQQRIDAAAPGDTIRLEPGLYKESLIINKPLTLEGAGWDKTVIMKEKLVVESFEEIQRMMFQRLSQAESEAQREEMAAQMRKQLAERVSPTALRVEGARDVVVRGIKFTSPGGHVEGTSMSLPIVIFARSGVRFEDCAVIGGPGDGIHVLNAADAEIERTLVAAVWGTGVTVGGKAGTPSRMRLQDCDMRNCHYAGVRIGKGNDDTRIERCRISGAAWHGIRYDSASPRVVNNLIFGNARSGIYASGETAAVVSDNLFYANEMCGVSCWFQNRDTIEGNTFVGNKRSGLEVLGASAPSVRRNIFYANPTGVFLGNIGSKSRFAQSDGTVALQDNLFWANAHDVACRPDANTVETIVPGQETHTLRTDPQFAAAATKDFSLAVGSPARQNDIGVADPISFAGPWPLQPEERAIIPEGDTRDSRLWRHAN
ncbi:MAG: right-handed parallel beta-helix repeat-containing protein [Sedimentisphaerales bacterium]|nr:right-handed parallel beta-helix repeat-containing protein [Sedimentisphaerales bacterium]